MIYIIHSLLYTLQRVTQHGFDCFWLNFFNNHDGFIFVALDTGKNVYLPFHWCLICHDCYAGECVGSIHFRGQCQKWKAAKFDGVVRRWYFMFCAWPVMCSNLSYRNSAETKHHAEFRILVQVCNIWFWHCRQFTHPCCTIQWNNPNNNVTMEKHINRICLHDT